MINVGDIVSRNKYNNDMYFKVVKIENNIYYLTGIDIRLCADSELSDLKKEDIVVEDNNEDDQRYLQSISDNDLEERDDFFYIPGKILHIDGDNEYLKRCLKFYKSAGLQAYGVYEKEENLYKNITKYLDDIKPDIVIITGHDAYYKQKGEDSRTYKNSDNFAKAIRVARNYEKSYDKLKIIAGACQSNYEELINAGANFASSPKRVNIHALDPAIIAISISKTENTRELNIIELLNKTKCGKEGIGGIKSYGSMYVGYPR
ncbi:MAG: sporulation peptidase YabG [Bacilli bacterium]|nr:sporulation peptidase YabG [Bacilli bacterium]